MNEFVERIAADLRAFSADLLEAGLTAPAATRSGAMRAAGLSSELAAIHALAALVPSLLTELQSSEAPNRVFDEESRTPLRATLSRRPGDYLSVGGRLLPARWVRRVALLEPDWPALRWLLFQVREYGEKLETSRERTVKQVQDARTARRGVSVYAKSDDLALELLLQRLDEAQAVLLRAEDQVRRHVGRNLMSSPSPPSPYPDTAAWTSLRRQATYWSTPSSFLAGYVRGLLAERVAAADVPYLYQRWVGLKLLQAFEERGWQAGGDPAGALFLAGRVPLVRERMKIDLWIEPRLTRRRDHPSGFLCLRGTDITPDFMLVTPGPFGPDAFVLDATKTTEEAVLKSKDRYLGLIAAVAPGFVAGVPVMRHPVRAWAAAPIAASHCYLYRADGKGGVVPMHPVEWTPKPIDSWVGDAVKYATAWARR